MAAKDSKEPTFFSRVEDITKLGLPLLGIIYAFGFIVVALYLSKFGVSPLSLVRVQYILAGIWLLLPFIVLAILVSSFTALLQSEYNQRKSNVNTPQSLWKTVRFHGSKIWKALVLLFLYIVISRAILGWVVMEFPQSYGAPLSFFDVLKAVGIITIFGILTGFWGWVAWVTLSDVKKEDNKINFIILLQSTIFVTLFLLSILGYIGYFSFDVYEKIPAVLGGGAPQRVKFMPKKGADNQSATEIIKMANEHSLSEPYLLLFSTEKTVVVIDPNNPTQAIEISKDLIDGVIFNVK